jgi:hypothetical protein
MPRKKSEAFDCIVIFGRDKAHSSYSVEGMRKNNVSDGISLPLGSPMQV